MEATNELPLACVPSLATDTRCVIPVSRSWTKMSEAPLVSPATRFDDQLSNATYRPSPLTEDRWEAPLPSTPLLATDARHRVHGWSVKSSVVGRETVSCWVCG